MKKKLLLGIFMMATSIALVGCGENKTPTTSNDSPAVEKSESSSPEDKSAEKTYAVILKNQTTDFWKKMWTGVEEEAKSKGIKVDLQAAQSEDDLEGQLAILESCLQKNYDGIAIAPLSNVNMIQGVAEATKKGITIVNVDEKFDEKQLSDQGGACVAYVATDNVAVGNKGGQYIVDHLNKGDKVILIEGKSGNVSSEDRANGAKKAFEDGGLNLVASQAGDWDRQKAMDTAATLIQQNPDLKGIYCCNDGMALGVVQAVKNANKINDIIVVGTDGDKEAIDSIKAGELSATVAQDPAKIGAVSLDLLVEAVENGTKGEVGVFPDKTPVESILVNKDNADQF